LAQVKGGFTMLEEMENQPVPESFIRAMDDFKHGRVVDMERVFK
jgi:hypothetical protein